MTKIYVTKNMEDRHHRKLESISDELEFVYEEDLDAEVIIGNVHPERLKDFKNLKWLQTNSVGVEAYTKDGVLGDDVILTNARDIHTREVAEHTFAVILSTIKKLYQYHDNQYKHLWKDEGIVKEYGNLKVCIVGFGDIGNHLAKLLKAIGIYTIGVKRHQIEKPEYLDELYLVQDLYKAISDVDVVVSILPGSGDNVHLFTIDTFRQMRKDTIFINVGRGNLYSEETLREVLDKKIIDTVVSDVFEKEPLDSDNDLWDYENMIITPHAAGSFHLASAMDDFVELCIINIRRYINNEELLNVVKERFD